MQLKKYQQTVLDELAEYTKECRKYPVEDGARFAFSKKHPEKGYHPFSADNHAPIVCIKVPTGGGKTLIASYSVGILFDSYIRERNDKGIVMWFVPSDQIRKQTLRALKNRNHPFRKVLDSRFQNKVKVFDVAEAKAIRKSDVAENVCVIISTISAFRREERDTLKVFQNNGALLGHFEDLPKETASFLEKNKEKEVIFSLANVIRMHNPLILVDEGHNIQTDLSLEMLTTLNPVFVLEFTATPRQESNVLVEIKAQALKDEKMIKMPIYLQNVTPWQATISAGIAKREELGKIAGKNKTGYIRPIMLIQAEQELENEKRVYVEKIKDFLINERKIPEEEIVIKTAKQDMLPDAETLLSEECRVKYIITVNALREGWDCPFAYILTSVSNLGAALSVEQTIGRIMRLPYVKEHENVALNQSYVFASTSNFTQTAQSVIDALKKNGYEDIISITGGISVEPKSYEKIIKEKISVPYINFKDGNNLRKIDYISDIIDSQHLLKDTGGNIEFALPKKDNEIIKIDVGKEGFLVRDRSGQYKIFYDSVDIDKESLISWFRFKIQREFISMAEMNNYLEKVFDKLLKKYSIKDLSSARYNLKETIDIKIDIIIDEGTEKHFTELEKQGKIQTKGEEFEFSDKMILGRVSDEPFRRNAYEKSDLLNNEELQLAVKIDRLPNVKWWLRNPEGIGFGIQGWKKYKFYPDFVVKTENGNFFVLEYKGKQLEGSEDTEYKRELGKKWAELSDKKYRFSFVEKNDVDTVISEIARS